MPGLRPFTIWLCSVLVITVGAVTCAVAQPAVGAVVPPTPRSVESALAVTLDRLSVRVLRADKPWVPRICIGCDLNNGRSPAHHASGRPR